MAWTLCRREDTIVASSVHENPKESSRYCRLPATATEKPSVAVLVWSDSSAK